MRKYLFLVLALVCSTGCMAQSRLQGMEDVNKVKDLTLDSLDKVRQARVKPGSSRRGNNPVLFLIGNSTMRNGTLGNGNNGQWGWGAGQRQQRTVGLGLLCRGVLRQRQNHR